MPEGDVVWRTARRLHEALAGRPLTRTEFRVPRLATADLRGREVIEALARGKHLLIRVAGGVSIHTHLRMDGAYQIMPAGRPVPRGDRVRLILANDAWQALGVRLGVVEVLATGAEAHAVGHLGPDLLGPDWDLARALSRLTAEPARPIGEALLDQRNLAGIGNLYKAEALFLRGVSPWCPAGEVGDLAALVTTARRLLTANLGRDVQITTGSRHPGERTHVYGRAGRPCRRCGTPIAREDQGEPNRERVTYWCPSCQPASGSAPGTSSAASPGRG